MGLQQLMKSSFFHTGSPSPQLKLPKSKNACRKTYLTGRTFYSSSIIQ